jgi:hypothetical protein
MGIPNLTCVWNRVSVVRNHPRDLMNHLEVQKNVYDQQRHSFLQIDVDEDCEDIYTDHDHARCCKHKTVNSTT